MPATEAKIEALEKIHGLVVDLPYIALHWRAIEGNDQGITYVWEIIASTQEGAIAYYDSLPRDEAVHEAAEALAVAGWTKAQVCFVKS